jgi:hypothetical protein
VSRMNLPWLNEGVRIETSGRDKLMPLCRAV